MRIRSIAMSMVVGTAAMMGHWNATEHVLEDGQPRLPSELTADDPGPESAVRRWIVVEDPASPFAFDIEIHVLGVPAGWCPADLDLDGQLNFFDIARFLQAFAEHSPWANLNEDTFVNFDDVQMFLDLFIDGCL